MQLVRDGGRWRLWGELALLIVSIGHILAGIIFFFAYNWADLTAEVKLITIQASIAITLATAYWASWDSQLGQVLVVVSSVLVGVLLAVFGQVYQTGADSWELFFTWSVLLLPWLIAGRNKVLWIVWLLVTNLAWVLYTKEILLPQGKISESFLMLGHISLMGVALSFREYFLSIGWRWLAGNWVRLILLFSFLGVLLIPAFHGLFDTGYIGGNGFILLFLATCIATFYIYWLILPDFKALTLIAFFAGLFTFLSLARITTKFASSNELFLFGLEAIFVTWLLSFLLKKISGVIQTRDRANE
ncbi:MAG: DUF2157 domain-containing protein [Magnetococcales bacterium]|nr:DUF2157 domain-containing protein [Magnetococcales bacterium]